MHPSVQRPAPRWPGAAPAPAPTLERAAWEQTLQMGLVIPLQGPAGIFGPSCEASARFAADEINASAGVLGRELRLVVIDGGQEPQRVADDVDALVSSRAIDAVAGWHTSAVRQAVAPRTAGRIPYMYTALYEGGESTPGVFLTGETPDRQLFPAIRWMAEQLGVHRWCIVGDDYVWPRRSAAALHRHAERLGIRICDEVYVRLGEADYEPVMRRIERGRPDGVLMLLVGEDGVHFNRAFAAHGLHQQLVRLSPLMDESMLLATGSDGTEGLYATAGFFESLGTDGSMAFLRGYERRHGVQAPVATSMGESCYEGLRLFAELCRRAGRTDVSSLSAVADETGYEGPRGSVHLHDHHLCQPVYVAEADGVDFRVLTRL